MTETLKVNPDRLKWMRNSLTYTQKEVGKKLRIKPEKLEKWENTGEIPYDKLEKLSELYGTSTLFFFNKKKPPSIQEIPDYRTTKNKQTEKTPEILKEIKKAKTRRKIILSLQEEMNTLTPFKYKTNNKEKCVEIIQKTLNIDNVKLKYTFKDWLKEFETLNILVFQFYNIPVHIVRGYALYYENLPIIGINNSDNEKAKTFTLFHEYAHLILQKSGISDYTFNNIEEICNSIAAEVLLPKKQINMILKDKMDYPVATKVKVVTNHFNISKTAVTYRLLNLNKISAHESQIYLKELKTPPDNTSKKREYKQTMNTNKRYKDASTKVINKNGLLYVNTLLKAKDEELIDDIELTRELDTQRETIPYIIKKVEGTE